VNALMTNINRLLSVKFNIQHIRASRRVTQAYGKPINHVDSTQKHAWLRNTGIISSIR
jgi:hypothetical protein